MRSPQLISWSQIRIFFQFTSFRLFVIACRIVTRRCVSNWRHRSFRCYRKTRVWNGCHFASTNIKILVYHLPCDMSSNVSCSICGISPVKLTNGTSPARIASDTVIFFIYGTRIVKSVFAVTHVYVL